jgi:septal ring factor EnvC (AmiA/AmiB activator)
MSSGKCWGWALPGLLLAAASLAQPPSAGSTATRKQLEHVNQQVSSQQAQARDLQQQIRDIQQRNAAEQSSLAARDREIAKLKKQLAHKQAQAGASSKASSGERGGH